MRIILQIFVLFFILSQYIYAGTSVFKFIFHNNTKNPIQIHQGSSINLYKSYLHDTTVYPGDPSKKIILKQDKLGAPLLFPGQVATIFENRWILTMMDQKSGKVLCKAKAIFRVRFTNYFYRYLIFFAPDSYAAVCPKFEPMLHLNRKVHVKFNKLPKSTYSKADKIKYYNVIYVPLY